MRLPIKDVIRPQSTLDLPTRIAPDLKTRVTKTVGGREHRPHELGVVWFKKENVDLIDAYHAAWLLKQPFATVYTFE